nr:hypothetical protein [Bathymodiolus heckerae thiotrophic gill symbiont]
MRSITYDNGKEFVGHEQVNTLNSRPRKCLGFKTPCQVFLEMTGVDARQLEVVHL